MTDTSSDTTSANTTAAAAPAAPMLRVVNADATAEEIAALVAVFASLGGGEAAPTPKRSEWTNPGRAVRRPLAASWRSSTLP